MARYLPLLLALALLAPARPAAASDCELQQQQPQRGGDSKDKPGTQADETPRWKWWKHVDSRRELSLADHQSKKIDEIWEGTAPKLRATWQELEKQQEILDKLIKENTADVSVVSQQVEKVEKLRAEHTAMRTVMIYRMHLLLTPEQRVKVDAMRAKADADRKRQDEERKRQGKDNR
jgi:Spy/CpxP family protein refolding chaperone